MRDAVALRLRWIRDLSVPAGLVPRSVLPASGYNQPLNSFGFRLIFSRRLVIAPCHAQIPSLRMRRKSFFRNAVFGPKTGGARLKIRSYHNRFFRSDNGIIDQLTASIDGLTLSKMVEKPTSFHMVFRLRLRRNGTGRDSEEW